MDQSKTRVSQDTQGGLQSRNWLMARFSQDRSQSGYSKIHQEYLGVDQRGSSGTRIH